MGQLILFDFTEDIIGKFKDNREIPFDFYNKDGQTLINQKFGASDVEIDRLLKFIKQGIYCDLDDAENYGLNVGNARKIPEGLTDTKLITEHHATELLGEAEDLFHKLKAKKSISSITGSTRHKMGKLLNDFRNQADAMSGLVNIIELLHGKEASYDIKMAVKRIVVAMSLKTRGMQAVMTNKDQKIKDEMMHDLMISALLCDIGTLHMKMPENIELSNDEIMYIRNHPLLSYLLIVHEKDLSVKIKHNILCHHRPHYDELHGNNYPGKKFLIDKLLTIREKYKSDPAKAEVIEDINKQVDILNSNQMYDEDANIIALASEFASLTSKVSWRPSYTPVQAVKIIVNNSYFTYSGRVIREFIDSVAISLCDNELIIGRGDFVILVFEMHGTNPVFEVCYVLNATRFQSRPFVKRLGTIEPLLVKDTKLHFKNFYTSSFKEDPRKAEYNLAIDDTRRLIYILDKDYDKELHKKLEEVMEKSKKKK